MRSTRIPSGELGTWTWYGPTAAGRSLLPQTDPLQSLAAFLKTVSVHSLDDGPSVGRLLAVSQSSDVVDGYLVHMVLRLGDDVLTGDPDDLTELAAALGPAGPRVYRWR